MLHLIEICILLTNKKIPEPGEGLKMFTKSIIAKTN